MSKKGVIVLVISMVVCTVGGFFLGNTAQSLINAPGSQADPMVAQSYVDTLVGERTAALQTQIEELESQIAALTGGSAPSTPSQSGTTTTPTTPSEPVTSTATYTKVEITGNSVNIRKTASTSSDIIATAVKGDTFVYIATEGDWYKVKTSNGTAGYIAGYLAKLK